VAADATRPKTFVSDNVLVIDADAETARQIRKFDLAGKSILFTPNGRGFTAAVGPLVWDSAIGAYFDTKPSSLMYGEVPLKNWTFPFGGKRYAALKISQLTAIFPEEVVHQFDQLTEDAALTTTPAIAPLLLPVTQNPRQDAYVKDDTTSLTVTWLSAFDTVHETQAVLFADGRIRFSYKSAKRVPTGALVLTTGTEAWRNERTQFAAVTDDAGDGPVSYLDIRSASVSRLADLDIIEVRMKMAGPVPWNRTPRTLFFKVTSGFRIFEYRAGPTGTTYSRPPAVIRHDDPRWAFVENEDTVVIRIPQRLIDTSYSYIEVIAQGSEGVDSVFLPSAMPPAPRGVNFDFASLTAPADLTAIARFVTVPTMSLRDVWSQVRLAHGIAPGDVDAVAIWQTFPTDAAFLERSFAIQGNVQASGIGGRGVLNAAHVPTLIQANTIDPMFVTTRWDVLMHEFAHRWLLSTRIVDGLAITATLNPNDAHAAQSVDTRAAFPISSDGNDSSLMGGGRWSEDGFGNFTSARPTRPIAFSWLDLYLMGLAAPAEVPPFFYIADAKPALNADAPAPSDTLVRGTRRDVTIDQVVRAMGERRPAYPDAQRKFRMLFVLVADPARAVTAEEIAKVAKVRREMETNFRIATGGRGELVTAFGPQRRRVVHR
jgi:hypothetical protein